MDIDEKVRHTYVDALGAYGEDVALRAGAPLPEEYGAWLELGVLLSHAAMMGGDQRESALRAAVSIARDILGPDAWRAGYRLDPAPPPEPGSLNGRIRAIAERAEDAGSLRLADTILAAFLAAHPQCEDLEKARIEAVRGRIAWKGGDLETAKERYARTARAARVLQSDELRVRAMIGEALLARLSGNYPRSHARARAALALAERCGMSRLAASAHHTIMVASAIRGRFQEAIAHGWNAYRLSSGDVILESEILGNLGQLFLDLGHPATAAAAFQAMLSRNPPAHVLLPGLGGRALASARMGSRAELDRTAEQVTRVAASAAAPYDIALALLDVGEAYRIMQDHDASEPYYVHARRIAATRRYHELAFRCEVAVPAKQPARNPLRASVETIAEAVRELVPA